MTTEALDALATRGERGDWFARAVLDHLPVAAWLKDTDGRYLGCNKAFERFFGVDETHVIGCVDTDLVSGADADVYRDNDLRALASDGPITTEEWTTSAATGRRVLWETTKSAVRDDRGELVGVLGFGIDITERVAAHDRIERQRRDLEEAERLAHIGHWNHDLRTGRLTWSRELYAIFGRDPDSFEPTIDWVREALHPDDLERADRELAAQLAASGSFEIEVRTVVDGQVKYVENRGHVELDGTGRRVRLAGTVQDRTERVLHRRRLESFYRLIEHASDAIVLVDVDDGTVVDANRKTIAALRATRDDVVGALARDFVPQLGPRWFRTAVATASEASASTIRADVHRLDGTTFPADVSVEYVEEEERRYLVAVARDVSAQVAHERSLQEAADQYAALLSGTKDGFLLVDPGGHVVDANDTYCRLSGYARDELVGRPITDLNPHVSANDVGTRTEQIITQGSAIFETAHQRKDGTIWPVEISATYADVQGGRLFVFFRDLTERHRIERQQRDGAERWNVLVNGTSDGFVRIDLTGRILEANDVFARLTGRDGDELVGTRIAELDAGLGEARIAEGLGSLPDLGSEVVETRIRRPDGTEVPVEIASSYTPLQGGQVFSFVRDVTERHRAAEAIEQSAKWFEAVLSGSSDGFLLVDTAGRVVDADDTYARLSGYTRDELAGLHIQTLIAAEGPVGIERRMAAIVRTGSLLFESLHRRKDGSLWPVEVSTSYTDLDGGRLLTFVRDISDRRRAEQEIRDGADRYRMLLAGSADGFARIDMTGTILEANERLADMFGWPVDELVGRTVLDFDVVHGPAAMVDTITKVVQDGSAILATTARRQDGTEFPIEINLTYGSIGAVQVLCFARDISDRVAAERAVRESAERYAALLSGTTDGFFVADLDGRVLEVNDELCRLTGFDRDELIGMNGVPLDVAGGPDGHQDVVARLAHSSATVYESTMRRKDGSTWRAEVSLTIWNVDGGRVFGFVRDVTERSEITRRMEYLAFHDPLTELPNRQQFAERLTELVERGPTGTMTAVCLFDLDDFKPVNDAYGHEVGDELLVQLGRRLRSAVGPADLAARIGGDEFVVLFSDVATAEQASAAAARLIDIVARPFDVDGHHVQLTACVGVTVYPDDDHDADTMLRHADQAMYAAKERGPGTWAMFDPSRVEEASRRRTAIAGFEIAIRDDQLVLHYQPRIELATGRVVGAEALVRWQHPSRGLLPPAAFLPLIEGSALELALDEWVLAHALDQLQCWRDAGHDWSVSVNISPRHIAQPSFPAYLASVLAVRPPGLADHLELEVLETSAIGQVNQVADIMLLCADLGVSFSLDDFGTGYSSLTYFRSLPVSVLKIDQDFVRDLLRNPHDLDIVEGVVQLAGALNRPVVAEGVESIEIGMLLLGLGCQYAQGFGIARPMPADAIPAWSAEFTAASPWRSLRSHEGSLTDRYDLSVAVFTHRRWVDDVVACVESGARGSVPATSSASCPVGQWQRGVGRARYGSAPGFDELGPQHRRLHELAAALIVHSVRDGTVPSLELDEFRGAAAAFTDALEGLADPATV